MATNAQSIQFLLSQVRRAAGSLEDGTVTAYAAGTTNLKTIWLDRGKQTEAANPYTLDANGTAALFGDGLYRFVIKSASGTTVYDRDYISIKDVAGLAYDVSDYASLAAAVTAIGSTPATLQYSSDQTVSSNLTIPANIELMPINGAVINHGAYTISYAGNTDRWPVAQIFNGTGLVTFGPSTTVIEAVWYQANTVPGTTNMQPALTKALASVGDWRGVTIPLRAYAIADTVTVKNKSVTLQGFGWGQDPSTNANSTSYLKWVGSAGSPMLRVENCQGFKASNFRLIGKSTAKPSVGIDYYQSAGEGNDYNTFEQLYIGAASWDATSDYNYQMDVGIKLSTDGTGGNDSNKWDMIKINQCNTGVLNTNSQHLLQHFSNLYVWYASVAGVKTKASLTGNNWFFAMNAVDILTYDSAERPTIDIQGFASEGGGRMLEYQAGAIVRIHSGYWQATYTDASHHLFNADSKFVYANNNLTSSLILEDFDILYSTPYLGTTALIDMKAQAGGEARNYLKVTSKTIGANNISMQPYNAANNDAYVDVFTYGDYSNPPLRFANYLYSGDGVYSLALDATRQDFSSNVRFQKGVQHVIQTLANLATPSVANGSFWITGGTTAITNFTGGIKGQEITILAEHSVTITNGTNIFLAGNTNFNMVTKGSLKLLQKADGKWYELSRSVN